MFSKIKNLLKCIIFETPSDVSVDLVGLISRPIRVMGLSSYTAIHQVHWTANVSTFCFLISCILQVIALFMVKNEPERLFECFSVLSFCGMGVLKLFSLRKHHKGWRFLLIQITTLENKQLNGSGTSHFEDHSVGEEFEDFSDFINNYTNKFRSTSTILTRIYGFTAVIFILSPFMEPLLCKLRGIEYIGYPHILPGWTPLDDSSFFGYIVTVLCEFISAVYCVCVHVAFDLTAVGIMIFVCGQFCLLRDYSSRIGGKGNKSNLSKKRDDRARVRIIHSHQTHNILVNSISELDKLLKDILGVYFFVATLTLCSVAVRLKTEVMSVMQLVSLIQYMCATLTQLFLFCSYGDAVMNESSIGMGQGPYAAAYWCLSPRVRRDLTILSAGMMRPRRLRAGPFHHLDLPSFIQIVRAAYSYYAVLGKKE